MKRTLDDDDVEADAVATARCRRNLEQWRENIVEELNVSRDCQDKMNRSMANALDAPPLMDGEKQQIHYVEKFFDPSRPSFVVVVTSIRSKESCPDVRPLRLPRGGHSSSP
jgi:hypothetical protein